MTHNTPKSVIKKPNNLIKKSFAIAKSRDFRELPAPFLSYCEPASIGNPMDGIVEKIPKKVCRGFPGADVTTDCVSRQSFLVEQLAHGLVVACGHDVLDARDAGCFLGQCHQVVAGDG